MVQKPPLGVPPKWFRQEQRLEELCEAVVRYRQEAISIPDDWLAEIRDLAGDLLARSEICALRARLVAPGGTHQSAEKVRRWEKSCGKASRRPRTCFIGWVSTTSAMHW